MLRRGDAEIREYLAVLREDPGSRVFAPVAEELTARGRAADAEKLCRRGLRANPDFTDGLIALARALLSQDRAEEAAAEARRATQLSPRAAEAWTLLAQTALRLGRNDAALEAARSALRVAPGDPEARAIVDRLSPKPPPAPPSAPPPLPPPLRPVRAAQPHVSDLLLPRGDEPLAPAPVPKTVVSRAVTRAGTGLVEEIEPLSEPDPGLPEWVARVQAVVDREPPPEDHAPDRRLGAKGTDRLVLAALAAAVIAAAAFVARLL